MKEKDKSKIKGVKAMTTETTIQKWGNSLAIRIPRDVAEKIAVQQGSEIELSVIENKIILVPKHPAKKYNLEELLSKVTPENRHSEINFGVEGNEMI